MQRRRLRLFALGLAMLSVVVGLTLGLAGVQRAQRRELRHLYQIGAVEAAGFVQALFETTQTSAQRRDYVRQYGGAHVGRTLANVRMTNHAAYMAVTDSSGRVVASDGKLPTRSVLGELAGQATRSKIGLALGAVQDDAIPLGIAFPVGSEHRVLIQGSPFGTLSAFLEQVLRKLPLRGGTALVVDKSGVVLAGIHQQIKVGGRLNASQRRVLAEHPTGERSSRFYVAAPALDGAWRIVLVVGTRQLYQPVGGIAQTFPWLVIAGVMLAMGTAYFFALQSSAQSLRLSRSLARTQDLVVDLEQMASATSHDIRGSLRRIIAFTSMLSRDYGDQLDERARQYIRRIVRSGVRLDALTKDLVEYARAGDKIGPRKALDVRELVRDALEVLALDDADVRFGPLAPLYGNPAAIRQVFQNLIGNGLKFSRDGVAPVVEISSYEEAGFTHTTVRDNGIGIAPQYRERIFVPFERLHGSEYPGTGIGLALVRRIIERHGGTIAVIDTDLPGTAIEFRLPAGDLQSDGE